MGGHYSTHKAGTVNAYNGTSLKVSLDDMQTRRRMVQNYLVIWVNSKINTESDDCKRTLSQLQNVVNEINICTTTEGCITYLNNINDSKVFVISSGTLGQQLVPKIHDMSKVDVIYIFCMNKILHEQWARQWTKIKGVFTSIEPICKSLQKFARLCDNDTIAMSFIPWKTLVNTVDASQKQNLDQLSPAFMYSVIFKKIIMEIDYDDKNSVRDLLEYCRKQDIPETQLKFFQTTYGKKSPIWLYTYEMFLYGMLNHALRVLNLEALAKMGFFIRKLHEELIKLHQKQLSTLSKTFVVYRGQGFSNNDFQSVINTKGGLLSFNNFLSTSKEQKVAVDFVRRLMNKSNQVIGVLFIITVDPSQITTLTTPFALIDAYSAIPSEKEILFTMHTIFRVVEINQTDTDNQFWEVHLTITDAHNPDMIALTNYIENELQSSSGWDQIGKLMLKVGHLDQAEELYKELLRNTTSDTDRAHIYDQLACVQKERGEYAEAAALLQQSLYIQRQSLPENHPSFVYLYNNLGLLYHNMGDYSKALEYYEKSLKIREITLPRNHHSLAIFYANIGLVYNNMGEYQKALEFYQKANKNFEKILPAIHPDMAQSYNNLGLVYKNIGDYSKALDLYDKSLKIREKTLPPNHLHLAISYSCIGGVYSDLGNYSVALEYYEKSHEILEKNLPLNHLDLAISYNNIGEMYNKMGDYSKALEFYDKSLKIKENILSPNHPDLAISYNNIGMAYSAKADYREALQHLKKALSIRQKAFPPKHPLIQQSINNIVSVEENV